MRKTLQELRYKCGRHNTDSAVPDRGHSNKFNISLNSYSHGVKRHWCHLIGQDTVVLATQVNYSI